MKKRVKVDSAILSMIIIMTGFLYLFPGVYSRSVVLDNTMDLLGFLLIIKGTLIRMAARGHKKNFSKQGHGLVRTGLYQFSRNPMYLGSCILGCGFVLLLWPWWSLPIFIGLFSLRFKKQVVQEEAHLTRMFGEEYRQYCRSVPRVFPKWSAHQKMRAKVREIFSWEEIWQTKEKRGLWAWPLLGIVLETFQQKVIFGQVALVSTLWMCALAYVIFAFSFWFYYRVDAGKR